MNDRFKFRATFSVSYYDENGNDKDIKLTIYDVAVYSSGEIGFSAQQIETVINALELPEIEQDTMWQFINDNYATSSYEWFVCDNAIVEQCTGLKDKNGKLIYEGDIVEITIFGSIGPNGGYVDSDEIYKGTVVWVRDCFLVKTKDTDMILFPHSEDCTEIIGNIHEQAEQKDVK